MQYLTDYEAYMHQLLFYLPLKDFLSVALLPSIHYIIAPNASVFATFCIRAKQFIDGPSPHTNCGSGFGNMPSGIQHHF